MEEERYVLRKEGEEWKSSCALCEVNAPEQGMLFIFGSKNLKKFICLSCYESILRKTGHLVDEIATYEV